MREMKNAGNRLISALSLVIIILLFGFCMILCAILSVIPSISMRGQKSNTNLVTFVIHTLCFCILVLFE
jgi:uncharacterized membrane protein HdeD (DUF308 family)